MVLMRHYFLRLGFEVLVLPDRFCARLRCFLEIYSTGKHSFEFASLLVPFPFLRAVVDFSPYNRRTSLG